MNPATSGQAGGRGAVWNNREVAAGIHGLLAPNPGPLTLDGTNTWLVCPPDSKWALVVDPGPNSEAHLGAIQRFVAAQGAKISGVVLTHGHRDHSAGAAALAQAVGCDVLALDPAFASEGTRLAAGDVIDSGPMSLEVVATAGHSADSVSFLVRSHGLLLTGDTILGRGTTVVAYPDGTLAAYLESLNRLRHLAEELPVTRILPGHGPTIAAPQAVITGYLEHRQERLEQIAAVLSKLAIGRQDLKAVVDEPDELARLAGRVVATVYADVPESVRLAALASAFAQLRYLAERDS